MASEDLSDDLELELPDLLVGVLELEDLALVVDDLEPESELEADPLFLLPLLEELPESLEEEEPVLALSVLLLLLLPKLLALSEDELGLLDEELPDWFGV